MADKRFDYDVTALGLETGLWAGWIQPEGIDYVVSCKCATGTFRLDPLVLELSKIDNLEDEVEKRVWNEHVAKVPDCPHRVAYLENKERGTYRANAMFAAVSDKMFGRD